MSPTPSPPEQRIAALESELDALRETMARQQQHLTALEKLALLGELVAGIAHELNTPLGALKSNYDLFSRALTRLQRLLESEGTDILRDHPEVGRLFTSLDELNGINRTASERMAAIVNSVRRYARQEEPEAVLDNLNALLDSALTLVQHEFKNRVTIRRDFGEIPECECFPSQLSQVFTNLLVNAAHAIEGRGEITIATRTTDGTVTVEIGDSGKGIDPGQLAHIFESGYTTKATGLGIGLAIVRQIIDRHHGEIDAESAPGQGTRFRIRLPIRQP